MSQFLNSLPTWFWYVCLYLLLTVFSFNCLYDKVTKDMEEYNKENEEEQHTIDMVYLYVSALFHPILVVLYLLTKLFMVIITIVSGIIKFILFPFAFVVAIFEILFGGIKKDDRKENDKE